MWESNCDIIMKFQQKLLYSISDGKAFKFFFLFRGVCFLFYVHECFASMRIMCRGERCQKRVIYPLKLEFVCHPMCAEGCTLVLCKNSVYS